MILIAKIDILLRFAIQNRNFFVTLHDKSIFDTMHLPDWSSYFPITDPTWIFFLVLSIILFAPLLLGRLRIPHIIGMILAGVMIGPYGFNILARDSSFELFGKVGLYYIMFLASLEMDMQNMRRIRWQAITLGLTAFVIPLVMGFVSNYLFLKYSVVTSILLASMYASHTLIAYPIVIRYGVSRNRSVSIAVGGTIVTDTLTLLVLAVIAGMFREEVHGYFWIVMLLKVIAVSLFIIYAFPQIGRWFFRRYNDAVLQYIFVLAMVFLAAGLMEFVGMEGILGAFLAGIVLNRLIPRTAPLMHHLEFVGNALFIPYFLIGVGMLIDLRVLFGHGDAMKVAIVMIVMALSGKWVASWVTQKMFKMSGLERDLMYGLSNAQAAATLAAVLVGYNIILPSGERLLNEEVLNGTILLILVTCVVSSFITESAARKLALRGGNINEEKPLDEESTLIALAYPETVDNLVNMALMMRKEKSEAPMSAINVVLENDARAQEQGHKLLETAASIALAANVQMQTKVRLATNLANGIIHTMKESDYSELVVGLHVQSSPTESFFGPVLLNLLNGLNRQITMVRCTMPINTIRRIYVTIPAKAQFEAGFYHWVERVARLAEGLGCRIIYHGHRDTLRILQRYLQMYHANIRAEFVQTDGGNELKRLSKEVHEDHLLIVVLARRGSISFRPSFDHIPQQIKRYYINTGLMLIFPDVYAEAATKDVSVNQPLSVADRYEAAKEWYKNLLNRHDENNESKNHE
ncbi:MAG TPA: cation:proton antiporter [Candidatus Paraprevotella stercorigallinarum]|jgi:Kef-type K+ transport system membrane component KefB|nr:cation:proton antiporter [Candidatus Paraprevotella stercorigallinarum]